MLGYTVQKHASVQYVKWPVSILVSFQINFAKITKFFLYDNFVSICNNVYITHKL
jgi:hypothetical protein